MQLLNGTDMHDPTSRARAFSSPCSYQLVFFPAAQNSAVGVFFISYTLDMYTFLAYGLMDVHGQGKTVGKESQQTMEAL